MSSDNLTAEEIAFMEEESLLNSRLDLISSRLTALKDATSALFSEAQALSKCVEAKAHRMYIIEDNLLRLQGKPGLSNQLLVDGVQPRKNLGIKNSEIEEIKMGVKTLRRKFQAAGQVVSTVGWWRHLKDKATAGVAANGALEITATSPVNTSNPVGGQKEGLAKLTVDTSLAKAQTQEPSSSPSVTTSPAVFVKSPILSPKTLLSPTSASTKKRNTMNLQQIFTPPATATAKQLHQHYVNSPSAERAHPSLGLCSPPMSPQAPTMQTPTSASSLMHGLSLRS